MQRAGGKRGGQVLPGISGGCVFIVARLAISVSRK